MRHRKLSSGPISGSAISILASRSPPGCCASPATTASTCSADGAPCWLASEARGDDPAETGIAPELQDHFAVSGEQRVQEEEAQRDLDRAVAALPPRYREVIALFHIQHRSYAEIARTLDVPMGTVMTWLHRARKELMVKLAEHLS